MSSSNHRGSRSEPYVNPGNHNSLNDQHSHSFPGAVIPQRILRSRSRDSDSNSGLNGDSNFTVNTASAGSSEFTVSSRSENTSRMMYESGSGSGSGYSSNSTESSGSNRTMIAVNSQPSSAIQSQRPAGSSFSTSQFTSDPSSTPRPSYSEYTIGTTTDQSRTSTDSGNRTGFTTGGTTDYPSEARVVSNRDMETDSNAPQILEDASSYNSSLRGPERIQITDMTYSAGFSAPSTLVDDRTTTAESFQSSFRSQQTSNSTPLSSSDPRFSNNTTAPVYRSGYFSQGQQSASKDSPSTYPNHSSPNKNQVQPPLSNSSNGTSDQRQLTLIHDSTIDYTGNSQSRSSYPSHTDRQMSSQTNPGSSDRLAVNNTLNCSGHPIQDSRLSHPTADSRMRTLSGTFVSPSFFEHEPRRLNNISSPDELSQISSILATDPRISRSRSVGSLCIAKPPAAEACFNGENLKEVSMAIKQYMDEADSKQHDLNQQIDALHRKLNALNLHIQNIEQEKANERAQFVRDKQSILLAHQDEEKKLEVALYEKDDQLRTLKKLCDKHQATIEELELEKNIDQEETQKVLQTQEATFVEERLKFEEFVKELHARIEALNGELLKSHEKDNITRSTETRLVMEIQLKNQELQHKHEAIVDLNDQVESLKEELKTSQKVVASNSEENTQLVKFGTALKFELSKTEDTLVQLNEENRMLKDELAKSKEQIGRAESKILGSIENEACLHDANETSKQMILRLQHNLTDLKEKNEHLVDTIKEYTFREKQLETKVEELTVKEAKLLQASSKTESKVKKEVENFNNRMRKSTESQKQEVEVLKETIRKLNSDHQKSLFDWQTVERDLKDQMQATVQEVSKSLEEEKRNVHTLQIQLEQSYVIIADLEGRSQELTRKSSDADAQLLDLEVNKTELQVQLEHQTKLLENLENDFKQSSDKDKQRKTIISQLRKKVKELEESHESQNDEIKRLKEEKDNLVVDLKDLAMRKEQLESHGKRLGGNLLEMNQFMQRTRKEVEQLRIENEHQVAANQQLSQNIEKFKSKHLQAVEKQRSDHEIVTRYQMDLKESKIRMDACEVENGTLKAQVHERMVALEQLLKENEKYKDRFMEMETVITTQKRNFQAKMHECETLHRRVEELTTKLTEQEEVALTSKQSCSTSQLETEALQKDLRTAKIQRDDVMRERDALANQLDNLSRERLRLEEQFKTMTTSLQSAAEDNTTLTKDKMVLSEYAKKLETDIAKGLKALQQQDAEITALANIKRELQESVRLLKEQILSGESQTQRLIEEAEGSEKRFKEAQAKLKKFEKNMEMDFSAMDKLKMQNSSMKIKIEELTQKQSYHTGIVESHKVGYNDLMKQYKKLEADNDNLMTQNGAMKARAIEMKAIVDGTMKKQDWISQNENEYRDEIQRLRTQNKSMNDELLKLKEDMLKTKMRCERLDDDLCHKSNDLEACNAELNAHRQRFENRDKESNNQIKKLEEQLLQLKNKIWDLQHTHDTMKEQCVESTNCLEKARESCDKKEQKIEALKDELSTLKVELQKYTDSSGSYASKNEKLQQNFLQLVNVMKKMKNERDSLTNIIKQIEEENDKLTEQIKKLKSDIFNAGREIDNGKAIEHKLEEDIEQLKSRINVLKYTETLRTSENQDLMEKLSKCESQLKDLKQEQHDTFLYAANASTPTPNRDTPTNAPDSDWLQQNMVIDLCQRLKDCATRSSTQGKPATLTDKYKEEMKSFMDDLFIKRHQQQFVNKSEMKRSASFPAFLPSVRRTNYRQTKRQHPSVLGDRHNTNFTQMESLYQETKHIQASLLKDIKNLSRDFAEQRRF